MLPPYCLAACILLCLVLLTLQWEYEPDRPYKLMNGEYLAESSREIFISPAWVNKKSSTLKMTYLSKRFSNALPSTNKCSPESRQHIFCRETKCPYNTLKRHCARCATSTFMSKVQIIFKSSSAIYVWHKYSCINQMIHYISYREYQSAAKNDKVGLEWHYHLHENKAASLEAV